METTICQQGAQIRCYQCGSTHIAAICHHCGRPMCRQHGPARPSLSWLTENREFNQLKMGYGSLAQSEGAHCEECVHSSPNYRRIMVIPGVIILLVGLYFLFTSLGETLVCLGNMPPGMEVGPVELFEAQRDPAVYEQNALQPGLCYQPELIRNIWQLLRTLLLTALGAGVTTVGLYLNRQRIAADMGAFRPDVPLGPISRVIQAVETLNLDIVMDEDGKYSSRLASAWGRIDPNLNFTAADHNQLKAYQEVYNVPLEDNQFKAGFLVLEGSPLIQLDPDMNLDAQHPNLIWLKGQVKDEPFLKQRQGSPSFDHSWRYDLLVNTLHPELSLHPLPELGVEDSWHDAPIRLTPLRKGVGDTQSISLELQINGPAFLHLLEDMPDETAEQFTFNQLITLDEVTIRLDESMGRPTAAGVVAEDLEHQAYQVSWHDLRLLIRPGIIRYEFPYIQLDQPVQPGQVLEGHMTIMIPALRSGLRAVRYYSALGFPVARAADVVKARLFSGITVLNVAFKLALSNLPRTQQISLSSGNVLEFQGVPDPLCVQRLLMGLNEYAALTGDAPNQYITRVVQDPRRIDEVNARLGRWHWDISGRRYEATLPVDFHVLVYGEGEGEEGITRVEFNLQGFTEGDLAGNQVPVESAPAHLRNTHHYLRQVIQKAFQPAQPGRAKN
ncbi:MAG: hypothetical protein MUC85_06920 [Anaerolineales bacterium]|nr:hypothetical protein [Anaerolineales bacterium]